MPLPFRLFCYSFMYLYKNVTIWPLVQGLSGLNVSAPVPFVICGLWFTAHSNSISNRAYVLENGRITMSGDANTLLHDDKVRKAYLGA